MACTATRVLPDPVGRLIIPRRFPLTEWPIAEHVSNPGDNESLVGMQRRQGEGAVNFQVRRPARASLPRPLRRKSERLGRTRPRVPSLPTVQAEPNAPTLPGTA